MIRIRALEKADGVDITAVGHAEYGPRGSDIVCAGVSALLYGFIAYLEGLSPSATAGACGEGSHLEYSEGEGLLRVTTRGLGGADLTGWRVIAAGLRLLEATYPTCVTLDIARGMARGMARGEIPHAGGASGVSGVSGASLSTQRGKGECNERI